MNTLLSVLEGEKKKFTSTFVFILSIFFPCVENVSLPQYDFPKKFPAHVQIISDLDLANVEFRNDPNIPCLRCRPCAKQVASPEIIYSPEVPLTEEVDPKKAATIDALFDDFLDSSDEGDNPPPPIGAPPKFSPVSPQKKTEISKFHFMGK